MQSFARAYDAAVKAAFDKHLAPLGFVFKKERKSGLVAMSATSRVWFHHQDFVPSIQRREPGQDDSFVPCYDLSIVLEAMGQDSDLDIQPLTEPAVMNFAVDCLVRLLVEHCEPVLAGDEEAWGAVRETTARARDKFFDEMGQSGLQMKDEGGWRELPELESVRVRGSGKTANLFAAAAMMLPALIMAAVAVGLTVLPPPKESPEQASAWLVLLILVPFILVPVLMSRKLLRRQFFWQTGPEGLTIGKLLTNRLIAWNDILIAAVYPDAGYRFQTGSGTVTVDKLSLEHPVLEASIWQHLNRLGKADMLALSPLAASFWARIPEETTGSLQWRNPEPRHFFDVFIRAVAAEALIGYLILRYWPPKWPFLFMAVILPVLWALYSLLIVSEVEIDPFGIRASTPLGKTSAHWDAVRGVRFVDEGMTQPASLQLRLGLLKFVRIPWYPDHPNSTRVMLSIMRRLRQEERFKLLPFPAVLLLANRGLGRAEQE